MCRSEKSNSNFSTKFCMQKCDGNIGVAVEQDETQCDEEETVRNSHILITGSVPVEDVRLL